MVTLPDSPYSTIPSFQCWAHKDKAKEAVCGSSLLVGHIPPDAWPIVYHPQYNISFLGIEKMHPFDSGKFGKIFEYLKDAGLVNDRNIITPKQATKKDLRVVHTKSYLDSLNVSANVAAIMEVPPLTLIPNIIVDKRALTPLRTHTGGSIMAAQIALERGWSLNLGGGFHHCSGDRGGGFCAFADITLAIQFLFIQNRIQKAMIVDLDAHQGNGHERDFLGDSRVYIMDMYNSNIYPFDHDAKAAIRRRVELGHHTDDKAYLALEEENLAQSLEEFHPDLLVYNAGTDVLEGDPLGCLDITPEGVCRRDQIVFQLASDKKIPVMMVTSGGYQSTDARVIADSVLNLHRLDLISGPSPDSCLRQRSGGNHGGEKSVASGSNPWSSNTFWYI